MCTAQFSVVLALSDVCVSYGIHGSNTLCRCDGPLRYLWFYPPPTSASGPLHFTHPPLPHLDRFILPTPHFRLFRTAIRFVYVLPTRTPYTYVGHSGSA